MTEKDTFIKWMNESGLEKVYEELEKILEIKLMELQTKKRASHHNPFTLCLPEDKRGVRPPLQLLRHTHYDGTSCQPSG